MKNLPTISQLLNLKNKTAIVTGGAMGIGFGIAYRLAEAGANVVIADMNEEHGKAATKKLTDQGFIATFVTTNVANEFDVQKACKTAAATHGGLDILVNNAGIYPITPTLQIPLTDFKKILAVNLHKNTPC